MPADKANSSRSVACMGGVGRTFMLVLAVALAACGGGLVPVHNIQNSPVVAGRGQAPNTQQVRDAIMRALLSRGWQVDREGPDGVVATMATRGNTATVLIRYDSRAYSISYLDSSPGLKFNGAAIHRRYNEWVDKLDKSIRKLLADVDYYPVQAVGPAAPPLAAEPAPPTAVGLEAPPAPPPPPPAAEVPAPPPAAGAPDVAPHAAAPAGRAPKSMPQRAATANVPQPNSPPGSQQLAAPPAAPPAVRK